MVPRCGEHLGGGWNMSSGNWWLGLDIGTSFCVAAHREGDQRAEVMEIGGQRRVPSIIAVDDRGAVVVGQAATSLALANPSHAVRAPKTRMGDPSPIVIGGRRYDVTDLVAALLHHLYEAALAHHGGRAPVQVRLTHPAGWGRMRVDQLRAAAQRAGLAEPMMVVEPVAAAVAYAADVALAPGSHVAVYDLGGGTFDTAVVQAQAAGFTVVGRPVGEDRLGGELFDELLANYVGERLDPQHWEALQISDALRWQQAAAALRTEARRAKEALSTHDYTEMLVALPDGLVQQRITRHELEALMEPSIQQSVDRLGQVVADAGLCPEQLAAICLTGGASHAPLVERAVAAAFPGVPIRRRGDPKAAVAIGAAALSATGHPVSGSSGTGPVLIGPATQGPTAATAMTLPANSPGGKVAVAAIGVPFAAGGVPVPAPGWVSAGGVSAGGVSAGGVSAGGLVPAGKLVANGGSGRRSWGGAGGSRRAWYGVSVAAVIAMLMGIVLLAQTTSPSGLETALSTDGSTVPSSTSSTSTGATSTSAAPAGSLLALPLLKVDSPVEQFLGTEIRRHWSMDADRKMVKVDLTVTNVAAGTFRWHHDEPVPLSVATDAAALTSAPSAEVMGPGLLLRWWYDLAPAQSVTFRYSAPRQKMWPAGASIDLSSWEAERARATANRQTLIMSANNLTDRNAAPVPLVVAAAAPSPGSPMPPGGASAPVAAVGPAPATPAPTPTRDTAAPTTTTTTTVVTTQTPVQTGPTPPSGPPSPPQPPPNAAPVLNCLSSYTVPFNAFAAEYYYKVSSDCFRDPDSGTIPQVFTSLPSIGSVMAGCAGNFSTTDWCWTYTPYPGWDGTPYQIDVLLFARDEHGAESPSITLTLCFNCQ